MLNNKKVKKQKSDNLSLAIAIILYNPQSDVFDRIKSLSKIFSQVYLIDNSPKKTPEAILLSEENPNVFYHPFNKNMGIAFALNFALSLAQRNKNDFLCTLDQDSVYPCDKQSEIYKNLLSADIDKDAIIALTPETSRGKTIRPNVETIDIVITSGNFINIQLITKKNISFNDQLFIDYVDFDFCHKIFIEHLLIKTLNSVHFAHTIGSPITKKFFGRKITTMNHSPIRDYYRYRNATFLYRTDKKFFKKIYKGEMTTGILKILIFEPDKWKKLHLIFRGIHDGVNKKLGPYKG